MMKFKNRITERKSLLVNVMRSPVEHALLYLLIRVLQPPLPVTEPGEPAEEPDGIVDELPYKEGDIQNTHRLKEDPV